MGRVAMICMEIENLHLSIFLALLLLNQLVQLLFNQQGMMVGAENVMGGMLPDQTRPKVHGNLLEGA